MEQNNNANAFVENLNDENVHYLVEKLENLDVNNIDVDTVNDVVLNCNSIIKNAADKADMILLVTASTY
jgi:tetrahydromethanopterin S-methyltransferase subunit A